MNTNLFKAILWEVFKTKNIEHANLQRRADVTAAFVGLYELVDAVDDPREETSIEALGQRVTTVARLSDASCLRDFLA